MNDRALTLKRVVLVVANEGCIRDLLRTTLNEAGFAVRAAPDGPTAVLLAGWVGPFHAALIDRNMSGMSGEETIAALRRVCPGLPCLLMSGEPAPEQLPEGCDGFLPKPFTIVEVVARLRALAPHP